MFQRILYLPVLLWLALSASLLSLLLAFVAEYGYGLKPCELCIFQRIPYAVAIVLAIVGLARKKGRFTICLLIGLCFLVDSGIAAYHTAVEKHWITGPEACTEAPSAAPLTVEQILAKIQNAPLVACDQPQWEFHGITMAALNAAWALLLAIWVFVALHKYARKGNPYA